MIKTAFVSIFHSRDERPVVSQSASVTLPAVPLACSIASTCAAAAASSGKAAAAFTVGVSTPRSRPAVMAAIAAAFSFCGGARQHHADDARLALHQRAEVDAVGAPSVAHDGDRAAARDQRHVGRRVLIHQHLDDDVGARLARPVEHGAHDVVGRVVDGQARARVDDGGAAGGRRRRANDRRRAQEARELHRGEADAPLAPCTNTDFPAAHPAAGAHAKR